MFHSEDRLYFSRLPNGEVRILKKDEDDEIVFDQTLKMSTWASIIASMSAGGEENLRWYAALDFHKSIGPIVIKPDERFK